MRFSNAFLKQVQGLSVTLADFAEVNPARWSTQLAWILDNGLWSSERAAFCPGTMVESVEELVETLDLTGKFTVETDFDEMIPLKEGGDKIYVQESNKLEFVELLAQHLMVAAVAPQLSAFTSGLREFISPMFLARWLTPPELGVLIAGPLTIDVAEWRKHTRYGGLEASDDLVSWFWEHLEHDASEEERRAVLRFTTGRANAPPTGFRSLSPRFRLAAAGRDDSFLPVSAFVSASCTNQRQRVTQSLSAAIRLRTLARTSSSCPNIGRNRC